MLAFLADNLATILIAAVLLALFVLAVRHLRRKSADGGCGCGCSGCPHAGACPSAKGKG